MVLTRSKPFWGQFWGQISETDSYMHRTNKCVALVFLRNANANITGFTQVKSPTNQYISFTLWQEVVRKHYSTPSPHTAPVTARNAPVGRVHTASAWLPVQPNIALNFPLSGDFLFYHKGIYLDWIFLYR